MSVELLKLWEFQMRVWGWAELPAASVHPRRYLSDPARTCEDRNMRSTEWWDRRARDLEHTRICFEDGEWHSPPLWWALVCSRDPRVFEEAHR